jgi:FtsZ-binding cell division protein ZapB
MDESFDLLEERIRKAAELVQRLKGENARLSEELESARKRGAEAEKRAGGTDKKGAGHAELQAKLDGLTQEVGGLREEREEIRRRIERLVSILEALD